MAPDKSPTTRLAELGLGLPEVTSPAGRYVSASAAGPAIFIAGQVPFVGGVLPATGRLGREIDVATGANLARIAALNALGIAAGYVDGLNQVGVVDLMVFVASADDFYEQHLVADGASGLFLDVFGERGGHSRTAIGVAGLPLNSPVEVRVVFTHVDG